MKVFKILNLFIASLFVLLYSCATAPTTEQQKEIDKPAEESVKKAPVPTEEETKSLEVFTEVLELVESTSDKSTVLPQIEALYRKIIAQYPGAPLAQESYWKLLSIYVEDYSPPAFDKAEAVHAEFLEKYPDSFLKGFMEDTLANSYYKNAEWSRLLELTSPAYKMYVEDGKEPRALMMYMYSEANYKLDNIDQAKAGYSIAAKLFPKLIVGKRSKKMLQKIEKSGKQK